MLKKTLWAALLIGLLGFWGCRGAPQMSVRAGYYGGYPYEPYYVDPYDRFYEGYYYPAYVYRPYPFFYDPFYDPFFFGADFFYYPYYPRCCFFDHRRFVRPGGRSLHGLRESPSGPDRSDRNLRGGGSLR